MIFLKNGGVYSEKPGDGAKTSAAKLYFELCDQIGHAYTLDDYDGDYSLLPQSKNFFSTYFGSAEGAAHGHDSAYAHLLKADPEYLEARKAKKQNEERGEGPMDEKKREEILEIASRISLQHGNNADWISENAIKRDPELVFADVIKEFRDVKQFKQAVKNRLWQEKHPNKFKKKDAKNSSNPSSDKFVPPRNGPTIIGNIFDKKESVKQEVKPQEGAKPKAEIKSREEVKPKEEVKPQEEIKTEEFVQDTQDDAIDFQYDTEYEQASPDADGGEYYYWDDDTSGVMDDAEAEAEAEAETTETVEAKIVEAEAEAEPIEDKIVKKEPAAEDSDSSASNSEEQKGSGRGGKTVWNRGNAIETLSKLFNELGYIPRQTEYRKLKKDDSLPSWQTAIKAIGNWTTWPEVFGVPIREQYGTYRDKNESQKVSDASVEEKSVVEKHTVKTVVEDPVVEPITEEDPVVVPEVVVEPEPEPVVERHVEVLKEEQESNMEENKSVVEDNKEKIVSANSIILLEEEEHEVVIKFKTPKGAHGSFSQMITVNY